MGSITSELNSKNGTSTIANGEKVKVKSTQVSVILNKSKKAPKAGSMVVGYTHMGVIKKRKDDSATWLEFRFANVIANDSAEVSEAPTFISNKKGDTRISGAALVEKLFSTTEAEDIRFHVDLPEEVVEAWFQHESKALKLTFDLAEITKGKDSCYGDITTQNYHLGGAQFDILGSYFGVGKKIDKEWILEVLSSMEAKPAGNVVSKEELATQSAVVSAKNANAKLAKKKAYKKAEALQAKAAAQAVVSEAIIPVIEDVQAIAETACDEVEPTEKKVSASSFFAKAKAAKATGSLGLQSIDDDASSSSEDEVDEDLSFLDMDD